MRKYISHWDPCKYVLYVCQNPSEVLFLKPQRVTTDADIYYSSRSLSSVAERTATKVSERRGGIQRARRTKGTRRRRMLCSVLT